MIDPRTILGMPMEPIPGQTTLAQQMQIAPEIASRLQPQQYQMGFPIIPLIAGAVGWGVGQLLGGTSGGVTQSLLSGASAGLGTGGGSVVTTAGETGIGPGNVPISGPGVPEPPRAMVAKQWVTKVYANDIGSYFVYFFKLIDGRIMSYNARLREWKIWRPKKNIVISSDPRISGIMKLERVYNKVIRRLAAKSKGLKLQTSGSKTKVVYAHDDHHDHH